MAFDHGADLIAASMETAMACGVAAALGLLGVWLLTHSPDLRPLRFVQSWLVPAFAGGGVYVLHGSGGVAQFIGFLALLGMTAAVLAPNIAHLAGTAVTSFIDPQDWTPAEEEVNLRPIRRLIDSGNYHQALSTLTNLQAHRAPSYESGVLQAKLLYQVGRAADAEAALLRLVPLSRTVPQQVAIIDMLRSLPTGTPPGKTAPSVFGDKIEIRCMLALFPPGSANFETWRELPAGLYAVEPAPANPEPWLRLRGENWAAPAALWRAAAAVPATPAATPKSGWLHSIVKCEEKLARLFHRTTRRERLAQSKEYQRQAAEYLRRGDWPGALPFLRQASAAHPEHYETAYRLAQAIRQTSSGADASAAIQRIIRQSQWTDSERQMLRQLDPGAG